MVDKLTREQRSALMAKVKQQDTVPEKLVRSLLHRMGYRFRLHLKNLPGSPDIVLPRHHKVVFVHGCFWHGHKGCKKASRPTSNIEYWNKKIDENLRRDSKVQKELKKSDWKILVIWECQTRDEQVLKKRLRAFLG